VDSSSVHRTEKRRAVDDTDNSVIKDEENSFECEEELNGEHQKDTEPPQSPDDEDMLIDDEVDSMDEEDDTYFEAGIILKVKMEDFMCHTKFSVKLGKQVNFLTGSNGTGKSAVVAAIQLCLGATAKRSGRANAVKDMIRQGSPGPAIISVELRNEGVDAYKPEEYGNVIIIERRIAKTGSCGYALMNKRGKVISKEKRELEKILQNFNIYVDNPCCVLTQDQAKTFINGAEHDKYVFFLKATGLELINEEVVSCEETIEATKEQLAKMKKNLSSKRSSIDALEKELKILDALKDDENEIRVCSAKMLWCEVEEAKEVVRELEKQHAADLSAVEEAQQGLDRAQKQLDEFGSIDDASQSLEVLQRERESLKQEMDAVMTRVREASRRDNEQGSVLCALQDHLEAQSSRIEVVKKEIADLEAAAMSSAEENDKALVEKLMLCSDNLTELENQRERASHESKEVYARVHNLERDIRAKQNECNEARARMTRMERELKGLSQGDRSRVGLFGGNTLAQLLDKINGTRFESGVFGPLGMHITLKEKFKHMGNAVEKSIWSVLHSFVVDNVHDRNKLMSMIKSVRAERQFSVIFQHKRPKYVINSVRDTDVVLIADAIQVDQDIVFNVLVDQCRIDQVIIVKDEIESNSKTIRVNGRATFAPGINQAVTFDGRVISYRNGNKSSEQNRFPYRQLLAADTTEAIAHFENEISVARQDVAATEHEIAGLLSEKRECDKCHREVENKIRKLGSDITAKRGEKSQLQAQLSELRALDKADVRFSAFESELQELKDAEEVVRQKIKDAEEERKASKEALSQAQEEKQKCDVRRRTLAAEMAEKEEMLENFINKQDKVKRNIERQRKVVARKTQVAEEAKQLIEKHIEILRTREEEANSGTPNYISDWDGRPLELSRKDTKEGLTKKISKLKEQISRSRERAGLQGNVDRERLNAKLASAKDDFQSSYDQYKDIRRRCNELTEDNLKRKELWLKSVKSYARLVARNFDMYMQKKGLSGTVDFNHKEQKLYIRSQTDNLDITSRCEDIRQMSGGERSYTTLCLLLALGHVIECPFRLMDEYDVFLDQITRKVTLDTIKKYALDKEQKGRQFIIMTPQSLSDVITTDEVRVHRMPMPVRLQQVLEFGENGA